jgi:hypothetical protein
MPDQNKLQRMAEEGYRVAESCATCLRGPGVHLSKDGWGKCHGPNRKYVHAKHGEKNLPAHWALTCDDWRPKRLDDILGVYAHMPWFNPEGVRRHDYGYLLAVIDQLRDGMNNLRDPIPMDRLAKVLTHAAAVARKLLRERVDRLMKERAGGK